MKYTSIKLDRMVAPPETGPLSQKRRDHFAAPEYELEDAEGRKVRVTHVSSKATMLVPDVKVERFDPIAELPQQKGKR